MSRDVKDWSSETLQLRDQAQDILTRYLRSVDADQDRWKQDAGEYDPDDVVPDDAVLTQWVVIGQWQDMRDPEEAAYSLAHSGITWSQRTGLLVWGTDA